MQILIIRHAESIKNVEQRHGQAANDLALTDDGKAAAVNLAKSILNRKVNVDTIYTSESLTALETARIISEILNKDIVILNNFKSVDYGIVCGMSNAEIKNKYPEIYNQIELYNNDLLHPMEFNIPEMESSVSFERRINQSLDTIIRNSNTDSIVIIIAHASTINMMINSLRIYPDSIVNHKYKRYSFPNLCISLADIDYATRKLTNLVINLKY